MKAERLGKTVLGLETRESGMRGGKRLYEEKNRKG
jgi:hypothetical protein